MKNKYYKIKSIIKGLSKGWQPEDRETSILVDHYAQVVYLETSEPYTARRWFEMLSNDPDVKFEERADTLRITVPWKYCRKPEMILMAKHRKVGVSQSPHRKMINDQPLAGV